MQWEKKVEQEEKEQEMLKDSKEAAVNKEKTPRE